MFAGLRESAGGESLELKGSGSTARALKNALEKEFPFLRGTGFALWADKEMVHGEMEIPEGAELALLPPVSGG